MPGTMWASVTNAGNYGMFRLYVCVDTIDCPLNRVILIELVVGLMLITGVLRITKCPVAPASVIGHLLFLPWDHALTLLVTMLLKIFPFLPFLSFDYGACHT